MMKRRGVLLGAAASVSVWSGVSYLADSQQDPTADLTPREREVEDEARALEVRLRRDDVDADVERLSNRWDELGATVHVDAPSVELPQFFPSSEETLRAMPDARRDLLMTIYGYSDLVFRDHIDAGLYLGAKHDGDHIATWIVGPAIAWRFQAGEFGENGFLQAIKATREDGGDGE